MRGVQAIYFRSLTKRIEKTP